MRFIGKLGAVVSILLLALMLLPMPVAAVEPPMTLSGYVYIGGERAPDDTLVEAKIADVVVDDCYTVTTSGGEQGYYALSFSDGTSDKVHLFVNSTEADESPIDYAKGHQALDLHIGGPPTVAFSEATYSVGEGDGSATITVNLSATSAETVTVDYATSDGTATEPDDYTAASGTLSFAAGDTSKNFTVTIIDDASVESDETLGLALSSPTNATLGTPSTADLTIVDNDVAPEELAADAGGPYTGTVGVAVNLSGSATGGVTPYNYAWDLDNDGAYDDSTDQNPSYTWDVAGDYTMGLEVTDDVGDTDTDTASVSISPAPTALEANAGGPYSGVVGEPVSLSGDATGGTPPYSYAWDLDNDGAYDDSYIQNPSYTWDAAGDYTVGLEVTDSASPANIDTDTASVDISEATPPGPPPVGGTIYPSNNLALLAPWIGLGLVIVAGTIIFLRRRLELKIG